MNRRGFISKLGMGAAAVVAVPIASRIDLDAIPAQPSAPRQFPDSVRLSADYDSFVPSDVMSQTNSYTEQYG